MSHKNTSPFCAKCSQPRHVSSGGKVSELCREHLAERQRAYKAILRANGTIGTNGYIKIRREPPAEEWQEPEARLILPVSHQDFFLL